MAHALLIPYVRDEVRGNNNDVDVKRVTGARQATAI
jgi:hypothetical protein